MSVEKSYGMFYPTCDICGDALPPEHDFYDAVEAKKEAGWKSRKGENGEWQDICTDCQ